MDPIQDNEFMCRCSPESAARCDEVRAAALAELDRNGGRSDHDAHEDLLFMLAVDAELEILADQWAAICITTHDQKHQMFQCDVILDGLCAAYLWLRQQPGFTSAF